MKLSVLIPVYNEEKTIGRVVELLLKAKVAHEIIIIDDGSTDGTTAILKNLKNKKIRVFHKENGGKGSALRLGLEKVTGDYILVQDADLEYHPEDIQLLIDPIENRGVQVVYGSRFIGGHSNLLYWHLVGNKFLNFLVNILYDTTISDMETCYKLIPTQIMKELGLQANAFDIEPEITCKILRKGIRIYEVPISYVGRDFSEGKKISWKDGVGAVGTIIKWRVMPIG